MGTFIDLTGFRFGRLKVLNRDLSCGPATNGVRIRWTCECDCSSIVSLTGHDLKAGTSNSCGCIRKELLSNRSKTHGLTNTITYHSWMAAKMRCGNPNNIHYEQYGGRGIMMCDSWKNSFENFLSDMGERPIGKTLDRIDVNGHYSPDNCRWATAKEQARNTREARFFEWRGETLMLADIAKMEKIPRSSLNKRFLAVGDMELAVQMVRALMKKRPSA